MGDNGAGKTTLIKALTGAIQPDSARSCSTGNGCASATRWRRAGPGSRRSTRTWRSPPRSTSPPTCSSEGSCASPDCSARCSGCWTSTACGRSPPSTWPR
ncbi:hypothetical protein [Nonomuraea dietziae]|uniref:hypothetical protein n=1 Tax=Nonomuraea dietziae TaxID=65515 RepID=UPI003CD09C8D